MAIFLWWVKYKLVNIWTTEIPIITLQILSIKINWSGPVIINEKKDENPIDVTTNKKKIFKLNGDLNRMSTSNKTMIEKRVVKK